MEVRIADPKALGYGAFAIGYWMYAVAYAGLYPMSVLGSGTAYSVAVFSTVALLVVALASFLRDDTWHAVFFMFWAALWWGLKSQTGMEAAAAPESYGGWHELTIALFSLFLWMGAARSDEVGQPGTLVALGVLVTFVCFALQGLGLGDLFGTVGGYAGLITALLAFWAAADALGALGVGGGGSAAGASGEAGGAPGGGY